MKKWAKWSKEEDERLIAIISEKKCKLQEAFRVFHKEYPERTIKAISARWYEVLRRNNNVNVCLVNVTKPSKEDNKERKSLWKRIVNLLKFH